MKQGDIIMSSNRVWAVISNDFFMEKTGIALVCPILTSRTDDFPLHILLDGRTQIQGMLCCELVQSCSVDSLGETIETLPHDLLQQAVDVIFSQIEIQEEKCMFKKLNLALASVMMLTTLLCACTTTAEAFTDAEYIELTEAQMPDTSVTEVRVNGFIADFPDGTEPYTDANGRAMIPVRFVTEKLGAVVTWNETTKTATIAKNGTSVNVTVGSPNLTVTKGGASSTVAMDTVAVQNGGAMYVPIRYVAESLGAFVDYSDAFNVIGIYDGDAQFIEDMMKYPMTNTAHNLGYEEVLSLDISSVAEVDYYFGPQVLRDSFKDPVNGFANSREFRYSADNLVTQSYKLPALNRQTNNSDTDTTIDLLYKEIKAEFDYNSANLHTEFISNPALIFHEDGVSGGSISIRGLVTYQAFVSSYELTSDERFWDKHSIFDYAPEGVFVFVPVDIHVELSNNGCPAVLEVVKLATQTPSCPD